MLALQLAFTQMRRRFDSGRAHGRLAKMSKHKLIFALDVDDSIKALKLVHELKHTVGVFKVGLQLFTKAGPMIVERIKSAGARVFLDLKLHDIPATVGNAVTEAAGLEVDMLTVHALGGLEMVRTAAVASALSSKKPLILAVTVLTSHTEQDLKNMSILPVEDSITSMVRRLAMKSVAVGATGIVSSAHEVSSLREMVGPSTILVTPGIRGVGQAAGDQARVMSPGEAIKAGSDYIVVGRPIRDAKYPAAAAEAIVQEMDAAQM
jgi:orotidine-5'-phosphate decarboxylase